MTRSTSSRRQFLALTAAGSGAGLAGCSGLLGDSPAASDDGSGAGQGTERRATLYVNADQNALVEARSRILQRVRSGELDESEAEERIRSAQEDIISEAVSDAESALADTAVTVEATKATRGTLLVSGPATALIDSMSLDEVEGLSAASDYEEVEAEG